MIPALDVLSLSPSASAPAAAVGLLVTALLLGVRHGVDWDHIAAITDITSTTSAADVGTAAHQIAHGTPTHDHEHAHGGPTEIRAHDAGPGAATLAATGSPASVVPAMPRSRLVTEQRHSIVLGTLYAFGHASVVAVLGLTALASVAQAGQPAPSVAIYQLDGKPLSLAALKGQVVVLDFWASWCGPCRKSFPFLDALQARHAGDGLRVVGLTQIADVLPMPGLVCRLQDSDSCESAKRRNWAADFQPTQSLSPPSSGR